MRGPTSGTEVLDTLIDGVRIGDNLVLLADDDAPLRLFVDRFVAACQGELPLVIVTIGAPWDDPVPDGTTVLDWSAAATEEPARGSTDLPPDADLAEALAQLHEVDDQVGTGAAFVFDRLTAVQAAWGEDAALTLFLAACPRLYRRRSLALWPVEAAHHRPSFLRRLEEITQVVVELAAEPTTDHADPDKSDLTLTVRKADGRDPQVVGRSLRAEVVEGDLRMRDGPTRARDRIGTMIREQRLTQGLAQAAVARQVGISPSALSQIERGVRGVSGDTLVRLWEVLGVPFGPAPSGDPGYRISRRSGRERTELHAGLLGEAIVADPRFGEVWRLEAAPHARGDGPPFTVKVPEVVTVIRGVFDLHLSGRTETLHEGDALATSTVAISGWANPGDVPTELLWSLQTASTGHA